MEEYDLLEWLEVMSPGIGTDIYSISTIFLPLHSVHETRHFRWTRQSDRYTSSSQAVYDQDASDHILYSLALTSDVPDVSVFRVPLKTEAAIQDDSHLLPVVFCDVPLLHASLVTT